MSNKKEKREPLCDPATAKRIEESITNNGGREPLLGSTISLDGFESKIPGFISTEE